MTEILCTISTVGNRDKYISLGKGGDYLGHLKSWLFRTTNASSMLKTTNIFFTQNFLQKQTLVFHDKSQDQQTSQGARNKYISFFGIRSKTAIHQFIRFRHQIKVTAYWLLFPEFSFFSRSIQRKMAFTVLQTGKRAFDTI